MVNCNLLRFGAKYSVKILKLKFRRDFEAEVWSVVFCCCLLEFIKLNVGRDSKARFSPDFEV